MHDDTETTMSDTMPTTHSPEYRPPAGPASWRDVYHFIEGMEQRLLARMDEIAERQEKVSEDHEVRIRVLERSDTKRSGGDVRSEGIGMSTRGWLAVAASFIAISLSLVSLITYTIVR